MIPTLDCSTCVIQLRIQEDETVILWDSPLPRKKKNGNDRLIHDSKLQHGMSYFVHFNKWNQFIGLEMRVWAQCLLHGKIRDTAAHKRFGELQFSYSQKLNMDRITHTCNSSICEAEEERSWIWDQHGLKPKTLSVLKMRKRKEERQGGGRRAKWLGK